MKRKILSGILSIAMGATLLVGCGGSSPATSEKPPETSQTAEGTTDEPVSLIFSSVSTSGDSHTEAMKVFADKVEELSEGTVTCKVYSDGSLFSSEGEFDAVLSGDADIIYVSFPMAATQPGLEWMAMLQSGYFWSSYDHMTSVMNGEIGNNEVKAAMQENLNVVPLSSFYLGSRVVNTRDKEINSYADMSGLLLRMPNSEAWLNLGAALGANPTPLSFSELYTALQTGAVDGQENPLPTDVSAKFYEVTKYIAITNHVIDCITPSINKDKWNTMSENQQKAVVDAMEYARQFNDEARIKSEEEDVKFLEEQGMTITYPDINEFKTNVQAYYAAHPEQTSAWDMTLYDKIQAEAK